MGKDKKSPREKQGERKGRESRRHLGRVGEKVRESKRKMYEMATLIQLLLIMQH